jgi:hypothetical protein
MVKLAGGLRACPPEAVAIVAPYEPQAIEILRSFD